MVLDLKSRAAPNPSAGCKPLIVGPFPIERDFLRLSFDHCPQVRAPALSRGAYSVECKKGSLT
jgi:hypothetical protein